MLCFIFFISCDKYVGVDIVPSQCTIIVYMVADNDLSEDALVNLKEMEKVLLPTT